MAQHGLEMLDTTVQHTYEWIDELDALLKWNNRPRSFRLLRAVFHALRDCLPPAEIADLASQLPALLRGVFYEGWRPARPHDHRCTRDEFLLKLNESFRNDPVEESMADAAQLTFDLLARKISAGEIRHVLQTLPREVRELWLDG